MQSKDLHVAEFFEDFTYAAVRDHQSMGSDAGMKISSRVVKNAESALPRCATNGTLIVTTLVGGSSIERGRENREVMRNDPEIANFDAK
jgi:hypothetical protein